MVYVYCLFVCLLFICRLCLFVRLSFVYVCLFVCLLVAFVGSFLWIDLFTFCVLIYERLQIFISTYIHLHVPCCRICDFRAQ